MSIQKQAAVTVRDLIEEAQKWIVFLIICVVGLSYIMSLTSSSVLVNLPAAAFLIIILRYFSLDFNMRMKTSAYKRKPSSAKVTSQMKPFEGPKAIVENDWRTKVNSPVVEDAIDQFTRHLVSEWVTDLWYSRITPDKQGPEELVQIINGVLGEISGRMRNINLIDFLTRDMIHLICTHLEVFRGCQTKIEKQKLGLLTMDGRDMELKSVLAAENKLHPALFSAEAEHKVLQYLMDGLTSFTLKPEDLQCSLFRYIVRELLACTVIRPVLNLASPRFINERIECLVISQKNKAKNGATTVQMASQSKPNGPSRVPADRFSRFLDPFVKGVELVQLKKDQSQSAADGVNSFLSEDPMLSTDTRSTRSWNSLPSGSQTDNVGGVQRHHSGGEWGEVLDLMSRRKTEALAPEHFENMWTKGRNYRKKEGANQFNDQVSQNSLARTSTTSGCSNALSRRKEKEGAKKGNLDRCALHSRCNNQPSRNMPYHPVGASYVEDDERNLVGFEEVESGSTSSYTNEDEEADSVTGLDSPGTKVWDGKNNRNLSVSHIHHPLESSEGHKTRKTSKGHVSSQRSRLRSQKVPFWQEIERTSFLSGDGQDILNSYKGNVNLEDSSDDSEAELFGRICSGSTATSSAPSISTRESHSLAVTASKNTLVADSFLKLRCEVLGANIVKSGSKTFAVYSISVIDVNNHNWSIKRRFRHFEEFHRRLKEFPEYNLHLPPKHFLSTGLDVPVIQERCKLLDKYLKRLLQFPTISGSIEVWDFLSVDSQTYVFSNSISIIETLSVDRAREKITEVHKIISPLVDTLSSGKGNSSAESKESPLQTKRNGVADGPRSDAKLLVHPLPKKFGQLCEDSGSDSGNLVQKNLSPVKRWHLNKKVGKGNGLQASPDSLIDTATDPTLPNEWVPPNLSVPILDLVDVIFQLQDGGWIRRKAFWVAKQVLQLGMGDAFDDWLIEKIQLLHRGSVVASGIRRVEQILWPDGIFITKHLKRQRPTPSRSPSQSPHHGRPPTPLSSPTNEDIQKLEEQQKEEAQRRAKFVYELMIDNAPTTIVGLVGRKQYEQCAKDLYYFLQSSVCLKQLAYDLLDLLLVSAFPELDYVFRQLHDEKGKFGEFKPE